ncbi:MAG: hypothetical protein Q8P81_02205 [Nanoarchaeota archaeon]|nr:hypothetical protein [Nanoarchaeota archaeon]
MLIIMKKIWIWIKTHWYVPLIIVLAIFLGVFMRKENNIAMQLLENSVNSYKQQIAELERLNKEKEKLKEEAEQKYKMTIQKIESEYVKDGQILDEKRKQRIKELMDRYKDNDELLSIAFAQEFGIKLGG